ncbi:hypothetical protein [Chryseobacterium sp. R2A-55]|uniref:hypothetical protein n=1 Tax=Chryseobacterium sp. R2A-55 TaxID=2744445 RepID=UPI001F2EA0AE|nr:hypothetical protein [Chryseobacterium sp. R2A-55]
MDEKQKVVTLIKDLIISRENILLNLDELSSPENRKEVERVCDELMMSVAWLKDYNQISDSDVDFDV